jgi:hypothetical protein
MVVLFEAGCADRVDTIFMTDLGVIQEYQIPLDTISSDTGIFTFIVDYGSGDFFADLDDISISAGCDEGLDIRISTAPAAGIFADDGEAFAEVFGGVAPYTFAWSNGDTGASADSLSVADYSLTVTDALGCQRTVDFGVGLEPTSLDDPDGLLSGLDVFPNPTSDRVTVRLELPSTELLRFDLYDINGRRRAGAIPTRTQSWEQELELDHLPAGVYLLRVRAGNAVRSVRLVKR